jgi:hypothetical protein
VLLGTDKGEVAVYPASKTPPQKNDVKKIDVGESVKSPVLAANGTLYVVTSTHLYAIAK